MAGKPLAIVSGGGGHVGGAITNALRKAGWTAVVLSRHAAGDDAYACDVIDEAQVSSAIGTITAKYGSISACVHASSPAVEGASLLKTDTRSFDDAIAVAVRGAYLLAKAVAPHMEEGSAFIGITTKLIEPNIALPPVSAYVAAKYGLRGVLRSLASELRAHNVRVYAVAPGFIAGGLNDGVPPAVLDFLASKSGAGTTTAEEVAALVLKLCTVRDAYPTGSSITLSPAEASPL